MPKSSPFPSSRVPVVLASADDLLSDDLAHLAAAAGVDALLVHDEAGLRRSWGQAGLLVLGDDLGRRLGRAPVRRDGVVLVARHGDRPTLNETALALGAERVVMLPDEQGWLVDQVAAAAEGTASGMVVATIGCRGGAGASTVVAAVARQAGDAGLRSAVVDADPLGADLDAQLGMADEPGLRWHDLASSGGRLPAGPLAAALPTRGAVALLSAHTQAGLPDAALVPVVDALARAFDLVLVDVPRWLPGECRHVVEAADAVVLVTSADLRGVSAAGRLRAEVAGPSQAVHLVVRATRSGVDPDDVAAALDLPHAVPLRHDRRVAGDAAFGELVMRPALRRCARRLVAILADS